MNRINSEPKTFWNQLESKKLTREQLQLTLFKKLGAPKTELQTNLAQELIKKIVSYYYSAPVETNYTIYSVVGSVAEIIQKQRKEGPRKGQVFYVLVLSTKDKLHAYQENLKDQQWSQITNLALLGQNLVFQYKKWISNKQVSDWYPVRETKVKAPQENDQTNE